MGFANKRPSRFCSCCCCCCCEKKSTGPHRYCRAKGDVAFRKRRWRRRLYIASLLSHITKSRACRRPRSLRCPCGTASAQDTTYVYSTRYKEKSTILRYLLSSTYNEEMTLLSQLQRRKTNGAANKILKKNNNKINKKSPRSFSCGCHRTQTSFLQLIIIILHSLLIENFCCLAWIGPIFAEQTATYYYNNNTIDRRSKSQFQSCQQTENPI